VLTTLGKGFCDEGAKKRNTWAKEVALEGCQQGSEVKGEHLQP
jgi:hypothetical protein